MNWAFVDYENVRSLESVNLASYQRVFIFCGPQNKSLKFDELPPAGISHIDLIAVPTSSKNNVDFHLAFHLGVQHGVAGDSISFHVISNDKGYQGLINHLELLGRSCKLVEPNVTRKVASKKAVAKKPASKPATADAAATQGQNKVKAVKPAAARKAEPESNAEPESKAKPAVKAEPKTGQKTAQKANADSKADSKARTGKTRTVTKIKIKANRAAALSEAASKLFAQLQITGSNRPKTKARVLSWLKSHVKSLHMQPEPTPDSIFEEWSAAGMLSLSGSTVRYPDA